MKNIDVIQILNFGVIGLGFLLAFMAYNLLSKEQRKEQPSKLVLNSISTFMKFSIAMAVIGLSGELARGVLAQNHKEEVLLDLPDSEVAQSDDEDKYPLDFELKITSTDIKYNSTQFDQASDLIEIKKSEFNKVCIVANSSEIKFDRKMAYGWKLFDAAGNLKHQYADRKTPTASNWVIWTCDEDFVEMNNGNYRFEVYLAGNMKEKFYKLID